MKKITTLQIARAAIIAALYATLTLVLQPISYGAIQCRIAECLTILPLFFAEAIPGLAIGCLISNLFGLGVYDIVFGTFATLLAAFLTYTVKKIQWGVLPPILINALVIPIVILLSGAEDAYWFLFLTVGAGQAVAIIALGIPLYFGIKKLQPKTHYLQSGKKEPPQETVNTEEL